MTPHFFSVCYVFELRTDSVCAFPVSVFRGRLHEAGVESYV